MKNIIFRKVKYDIKAILSDYQNSPLLQSLISDILNNDKFKKEFFYFESKLSIQAMENIYESLELYAFISSENAKNYIETSGSNLSKIKVDIENYKNSLKEIIGQFISEYKDLN